jgi:O-antigen/teichoic acid export membrane protein
MFAVRLQSLAHDLNFATYQMKNIAANSLWNLSAFGCGVVANLLTIPFVLAHIGASAFGTASLVQALAAPLVVVGTSISQATAQALSVKKASAPDLIAAAGMLGLICTFFGVVFLSVAGKEIAIAMFRIDHAFLNILPSAFGVASIGWVATVGTGVLQSIYVADQQYSRISQINALGAICSAISMFVLVSMYPTMLSYILGINMGFVAIFAAFLFFALKEKRVLLAFPAWNLRTAKLLTSFGGWQVAAQVGGIAANQADRYLLGVFVKSEAVAWYSIAQRLQEVAYIGVYKAGEVLFPVFGAEASSSRERRADLFARATWILNTVAACVLGPILALAHDILKIWTGDIAANNGAKILSMLALAGLLGSAANGLNFYLLGTGRPRINFALALLTAVISCSVSLLLLPRFGFAAAGAGSITAMCIQFIAVIVVLRKSFGPDLAMPRILAVISVPLATGGCLGFCFRFLALPAPTGWLTLALQFGLFALIIATVCMLWATLTRNGRRSLMDMHRISRLFAGQRTQ